MGDPRIELVRTLPVWRDVPIELALEITLDHPLDIATIELHIEVVDGWRVFGTSHHVVRTSLERELVGRATLPAGTHRFPIRFSPPAAMAPTHDESPAYSTATLRVVLKNPRFWRVDISRKFPLAVREPPPAHLAREIVKRSVSKDNATLELALAATELVIGEELVGWCTLTDDRDVTFALVPRFELFGGPRREIEIHRGTPHPSRLSVPAGRRVPF